MSALDSKEKLTELYLPAADDFSLVDVPDLRYIMVDGAGDPGGELFVQMNRWLFTVIHPIRIHARKVMGKNFIEPPLECVWWADDMQDLIDGKKDKFKWRLMVVAELEWLTQEVFDDAVAQASKTLGAVPPSLGLDNYSEGQCVQIMHIGPPGSQSPTTARMYGEFLPAKNLTAHGYYHEIYLNDPRRTAPDKLKTVLRQPVCANPSVPANES